MIWDRCASPLRRDRGSNPNGSKKSTSSGDRTHDHKIKSLALYHLSYGGPLDGTLCLPMQADHPPSATGETKKGIHKPGIEPGTFCV